MDSVETMKQHLDGTDDPILLILKAHLLVEERLRDVLARICPIPNAELEIIPNVMHYTFLARCNLLGIVVARSLCTDPDEIDREEVHRRVSADALKFFNRTLQGDPADGLRAPLKSNTRPQSTHRLLTAKTQRDWLARGLGHSSGQR